MISRSRPIQRVLSYLRLYRRWLGTQLPRADIDEIAYHVAAGSGSLEAADRLLESIYEHFRCWNNIGFAGRRLDELRRGLRIFAADQYPVSSRGTRST